MISIQTGLLGDAFITISNFGGLATFFFPQCFSSFMYKMGAMTDIFLHNIITTYVELRIEFPARSAWG